MMDEIISELRRTSDVTVAPDGTVSVRFSGGVEEARRLSRLGAAVRAVSADLAASDATLKEFARLPQLESLCLFSQPRITAHGIHHLREFGNLKKLTLFVGALMPEAVEHIGMLSSLRELELYFGEGTSGEDAGEFDLWWIDRDNPQPRIEPGWLLPLERLAGLETLKLSYCTLQPNLLQELQGLGNLRKLYLNRVGLGPNSLVFLPPFPQLKELSICEDEICDADLPALRKFTSLKDLTLARNPIHAGGISHLATLDLERLSLWCCPLVDDSLVGVLVSFHELAYLSICGTRITTAGAARLAAMFPDCDIDLVGLMLEEAAWRAEALRSNYETD